MARPLSSTPQLWRLPFGHFSESDTHNLALRTTILARDANRCVDCQLSLPRHMEVRHLDDDHENMAPTNLACVCPFCHLRDHLGPTGFAGAGIVIGTPTTLTQGQINTLALSIWYIQSRIEKTQDIRSLPDESQIDTEQAWRQRLLNTATTLWNDLATKDTRWTGAYSPLISEPDILGGVLNELYTTAPETYANRDELLHGLHILPVSEAFETQCADWFAEFDRSRPISSWGQGLDSLMGRIDSTPDDFFQAVRKSLRADVRAQPEAVGRSPSQGAPSDAPALSRPAGVGKRYQ